MTQHLPQLFSQMGGKGRQKKNKGLKQGPRTLLGLRHLVRKHHHLGDRRIESQSFDVLSHLLDRLVEHPLVFERRNYVHHSTRQSALFIHHEPPRPFEKPCDPFHTPRTPRLHGLQRAHEHFVEPHRIGPELVHHLIGIHDIAAGFRHLLVVFP